MKLLQPYKIGKVDLKNRIIMPAMHTGFCEGGYIKDQAINYYRERARGGVSLIIVGGCVIDPYPSYWSLKANAELEIDKRRVLVEEMGLGDDKFIPGHKLLVKAVHEEGAKIGAQLMHLGRVERSEWLPISASAVPSSLTGVIPREMTIGDIKEAIGLFAAAARRVKEAGYDLVEVIGGGGYLLSQFLSPIVNFRTDEYGGSFENRARFAVEVIMAIRQAVGPDFTIMVRMGGNDFVPGSSNIEDAKRYAQLLEEAGADALNVTGGWHETNVPQITMNVPPGAFVYLAQGIKPAVNVPVVACNRINDPFLAEEILVNGRADLIGMARGLMADPELPKKIAEGRYYEIRKCVGCNQGCLDNIFQGKKATCMVNSQVGRENETKLVRVEVRKKVLVIGGGAAGMEAARVAALRGHAVTLWEKNDKLGGQILKAGAVPGRGDLLNIIDYLEKSLALLEVEVELNKEVRADEIREFAPEYIIFASGANPTIPSIPGIKGEHVIEAGKILMESVEIGRRIIILGGGAVGCEVGIHIAHMGTIDSDTIRFLLLNDAENVETIKSLALHGTKEIVILEMDKTAGRGLGNSTRWFILKELKQMGVRIMTSTVAKSIVPEGVVVTRADGQEELIAGDNVILAIGSSSENSLYQELKDEYPSTCLIGDAKQVRTLVDSIREGFDAGFSI